MRYNKTNRVVSVVREDFDTLKEYQRAYRKAYREANVDYQREYRKNNQLRLKYLRAKDCARIRGIEWLFTFERWVAWWGDDIVRRGKNHEDLVMARYRDTGPYIEWNVRKATYQENLDESRTTRRYKKTI